MSAEDLAVCTETPRNFVSARPPALGRRSGRALALVTAGVGLFALVNLPFSWLIPVLVIAVTAAVAAAVSSPRAGGLLALGGAAVLGLAALHIVLFQAVRRYPADFGWTTNFPFAHVLGLLGVLLLAGEAVRDLVRRRPAGD